MSEARFKVERIHRVDSETPLKAFVDISVNGALLIKGIKIVDGKNGLFISMPADKAKDNKWYENVRCMSKEIREQLSEEIISSYMAEAVTT